MMFCQQSVQLFYASVAVELSAPLSFSRLFLHHSCSILPYALFLTEIESMLNLTCLWMHPHFCDYHYITLHSVPLTTSKKMQKKLLIRVRVLVVTELFNITINDFDAKKSVRCNQVLIVTVVSGIQCISTCFHFHYWSKKMRQII